jgi:hypothetical protein
MVQHYRDQISESSWFSARAFVDDFQSATELVSWHFMVQLLTHNYSIYNTTLWDVMPCSLVAVYQCFGE